MPWPFSLSKTSGARKVREARREREGRRTHVGARADNGVEVPLAVADRSEAKIAELELGGGLGLEEEVLGLEVTVGNVGAMDVHHDLGKLGEEMRIRRAREDARGVGVTWQTTWEAYSSV